MGQEGLRAPARFPEHSVMTGTETLPRSKWTVLR
jgi:hypothetical protein